jgi:hypothetical protein
MDGETTRPPAPEDRSDPKAFVALFQAAAGTVPCGKEVLPPIFWDSAGRELDCHSLGPELRKLEDRRAEVWRRGIRWSRHTPLNQRRSFAQACGSARG